MGEPAADPRDPTIYRVEDDLGEHEIQTYILELLRPLIERYLCEQGVQAHAGSDQFIYWVQYDPQACMAPDIYVLPGVPQDIAIDVWKVWERGVVPSFVLEVVGRDPRKDYEDSPRRCAELGVAELCVFDPFAGSERCAFTVYRRDAGVLRHVESTDGDRVWSEQLGCWVRRVGTGAATRVRLGLGDTGDVLFPTAEEAALADKNAALADKNAALTDKEAERAEKEAALRRIAELEDELKRRS